MQLILLDEKLLGLVEMMSGLVNASFSLPEWQAVKMIFFAPCTKHNIFHHNNLHVGINAMVVTLKTSCL